MNKRIWKLYKELRDLRKQVVALHNSLISANNEIKSRNSLITFLEESLRQKTAVDVPYSTMSFVVPNLYMTEKLMSPTDLDRRPRSEYITKRLTNEMKVKLFDDLAEQGYIRKTRDDEVGEVYEIKVVR
jgi:hypothetical protein